MLDISDNMNFDELCELLKENGFRKIGRKEATELTFVNEDYSLNVSVTQNVDKLSNKETELIEKRLRELGYMD